MAPRADGPGWLRYLPDEPVPAWRGLAIAAGATVAGAALRLAFGAMFVGLPYITFFPAVAAAAVWGGWLAGVITIGASAVLVGVFWVPTAADLDVWTSRAVATAAFVTMGLVIVGMIHLLHLVLREAAMRRREAHALAGEMEHRTANLLTLVQSMIRLTAGRAGSVEEFAQALRARVEALGRSQRVLTAGVSDPVPLPALAEMVLEPFDLGRIDIGSLGGAVPPREAIMLGMVFHELATNAVKHGALSAPGGTVSIAGGTEGEAVTWKEAGGPTIAEPSRRGSGSRLIEAFAARGHAVEQVFEPDGLLCRIRLAPAGRR